MSINEAERDELVERLENFEDKLIRYHKIARYLVDPFYIPLGRERGEFDKLRRDLQRAYGGLKLVIREYGESPIVDVDGTKHDAFAFALSKANPIKGTLIALDGAITALNMAIGRVESPEVAASNKGIDETKVAREIVLDLFDGLRFHPKIVEVSRSLFVTHHYAQSIFAAFKAVNNHVKQKTGLELDGKKLMTTAFSKQKPIIRLNKLVNQSDEDEQEGFMFLLMGAIVGIRNPKAHDEIVQNDPYKTLEYLGFASLLMKKIDEAVIGSS